MRSSVGRNLGTNARRTHPAPRPADTQYLSGGRSLHDAGARWVHNLLDDSPSRNVPFADARLRRTGWSSVRLPAEVR